MAPAVELLLYVIDEDGGHGRGQPEELRLVEQGKLDGARRRLETGVAGCGICRTSGM
jgi:hypothetical protein